VTQVGQEPLPVGQAAFRHAQVPSGPGVRVRVEAGTLMQKLLPRNLVEPYLTSQRSVLTGFVHRAEEGVLPDPAFPHHVHDVPGQAGQPGQETAGIWVLRWRALDIQTYLASAPAPVAFGGGPGWLPREAYGEAVRPAFELFIAPGPIPVGTEMYRITPAGEEFIARHDGQSWLRPKPELQPGPGPGPEG
jgi:hypothetical protein